MVGKAAQVPADMPSACKCCPSKAACCACNVQCYLNPTQAHLQRRDAVLRGGRGCPCVPLLRWHIDDVLGHSLPSRRVLCTTGKSRGRCKV